MLRRDIAVRIDCAMPDRLIRIATKEGVCIRRAERMDGRNMQIICREADAHRLLQICAQYHVNAKITGAAEREPMRAHIRRRWTLLIGMILCAALMILFLGRIWAIDIRVDGENPTNADRTRILEQCQYLNIHIGAAARGADTDLLQKNIVAQLPDLKYAGVHREGIRLCIDARTETPAPETFEIEIARDIVAARDGIIVSVEADSGHACVQAGDAVRAGQTLILGEEAISKEETAPVGASGRVLAKCWFEGRASGSLRAEVSHRTGSASRSTALEILNYTVPLTAVEPYARCELERKSTPIGGMFIPLAMITETRYETESAIVQTDAEALQKKLAALARSEARSLITESGIADAHIADYWENMEITGTDMHVHAVYEIITDIAVTRDDLTKEGHAAWKAMNK